MRRPVHLYPLVRLHYRGLPEAGLSSRGGRWEEGQVTPAAAAGPRSGGTWQRQHTHTQTDKHTHARQETHRISNWFNEMFPFFTFLIKIAGLPLLKTV